MFRFTGVNRCGSSQPVLSFLFRQLWRVTFERRKYYQSFSSRLLTASAAAERAALAFETQLRRPEKSWCIFLFPENCSCEGFSSRIFRPSGLTDWIESRLENIFLMGINCMSQTLSARPLKLFKLKKAEQLIPMV